MTGRVNNDDLATKSASPSYFDVADNLDFLYRIGTTLGADKNPTGRHITRALLTGSALAGVGGLAQMLAPRKKKSNKKKKSPRSSQLSLPRAALGVDSAGRRATPKEEAMQRRANTSVQHREPVTSGKTASSVGLAQRIMRNPMAGRAGAALAAGAGAYGVYRLGKGVLNRVDHAIGYDKKTAGLATQLGEAVMKRVELAPNAVQRGVGMLHNLGARLGAKSTESAVGRGILAVGGTAAGAGTLGTLGVRALARKKEEATKSAGLNERVGKVVMKYLPRVDPRDHLNNSLYYLGRTLGPKDARELMEETLVGRGTLAALAAGGTAAGVGALGGALGARALARKKKETTKSAGLNERIGKIVLKHFPRTDPFGGFSDSLYYLGRKVGPKDVLDSMEAGVGRGTLAALGAGGAAAGVGALGGALGVRALAKRKKPRSSRS
jgi:hypothetical protein